ncbi:MAG: DUF1549 domain-containing protein [Planctomycetes bacterium]|nr:DUF1549 domain-containing protein [Planctomycetota bacterium]
MVAKVVSCVGIVSLVFGLAVNLAVAKPDVESVANNLDMALAEQVFSASEQLAPSCDDATYLRRVWLDLVGDIPTPEEVIAFSLDPSADKRRRVVRQLLESPHYGQNWARYWRDVIFFRALDERALIAAGAMEADITKRLNDGDGWDEIAVEFMTARGDVKQNGSTAIVMAQGGRTEETTSEMSRIFLGIQIQCAQCHDHPYDRWKRKQFHELAAFFPRVGVRTVRAMTKRSYEVYTIDRFRDRKPKNTETRPTAEHFMPNLNDPSAKGTQIQPKFFLTRATMPLGTSDADRREQLAQWFTENEWFAIALVNRMWSELVGEGFYEPIDDIGPDREASAPKAVKLLATKFRKSNYDLRWLLETICATEAYQRESRPRRSSEGTPFVANVPQRLRSDQLFNALYSALDIRETPEKTTPRRPGRRGQFAKAFGYDPSLPREGISVSIPQVLTLMNSPQVNDQLTGGRKGILGRLLHEIRDDEQLVVEFYLRCLSRQPEQEEMDIALAYIDETPKRRPAFEDLLWSLVNSAEFQHRR